MPTQVATENRINKSNRTNKRTEARSFDRCQTLIDNFSLRKIKTNKIWSKTQILEELKLKENKE